MIQHDIGTAHGRVELPLTLIFLGLTVRQFFTPVPLRIEMADGVSETAWVGFHSGHLDDLDFNPSNDVDFLRQENFRQISQEFRVVSPTGGRIEYLMGSCLLARQLAFPRA